MRVVYLLSSSGNPLYGGQYELNSRYQTYGQHSFIYDLVRAASRRGILVDLLIDGRDTFPLTVPLASSCDVHDFETAPSLALADADFALVDEIPEHLLNVLPDHVRAFCIVHNAAADYPDAMKRRCTKFLCMTETAFRYQSRTIPIEKLVLIRQGVDLERFMPKPRSLETVTRSAGTRLFAHGSRERDDEAFSHRTAREDERSGDCPGCRGGILAD